MNILSRIQFTFSTFVRLTRHALRVYVCMPVEVDIAIITVITIATKPELLLPPLCHTAVNRCVPSQMS